MALPASGYLENHSIIGKGTFGKSRPGVLSVGDGSPEE